MSALAEDIAGRATDVRERIAKAGGDPARVRIVAVTKGFGPDVVAAAFAAGLTEFGENYADELIAKWDTLGRRATWHFLGTVQRNKIPRLAGYVDCWQAVARVVEGEAIKRRRAEAQGESSLDGLGPARMLVEVETTGRLERGGCVPEEVPGVVSALRELGCNVEGLMTVAPQGDADKARAAFEMVAGLRKELGLRELSMGMSDDLEQAVAAGATMVRLGTALFGPRPQRRRL